MNKWVKRTSIALGALALCGVAAAVLGKSIGEKKMVRTVAIQVPALAVAPDTGRVEHGRYLYSTRGCAECHGADGAGKTVIQDGGMLVIAPNITAGPRGTTANYQVIDWVRTIRHGIKPDGRPVMVMPSEDYARLTDEDTAALIAYVQQLPPVAGKQAVVELPAPVKAMYAFGLIKDASEKIDHTLAPARPVVAAVTVEHGAYMANACIGCHGATLSGGRIPGSPPAWPAAANLTPGKGSAMARYPTPDAFIAMLRSGHRPDGKPIAVMPFASLKQINDTDARALYAFLKTVPAKETGLR
ncbi:Fructose dehydrogenase cytochrome subunit [Massilia sp. Bi118]|uniref:c-type cytochrome n=1 Tax=Massilia sp. Bi118 TaxID=2822346 RepID=UPI001DBE46A6|nr:c-type cytochrome [Massilia sp. Bi118]CAH0275323.1 Fructose dehydrogenase cytochrome subunit [Massilia sp. Bi118]